MINYALSKFAIGPGPTTPGPVALSPESVQQASPGDGGEQPMYVEEGGGIVISDGGGDSGGGGLGGAVKTCTLVPEPFTRTTLASSLLIILTTFISLGLLVTVREKKK